MGETILFWMSAPPSPGMDPARWSAFCDTMAGSLLGLFILFTILTAGLYAVAARSLKIYRAADVFQPFRAIHWMWLAWAPAFFLFRQYQYEFHEQFPNSFVSPLAGAIQVAIFGGSVTFIAAYLAMCAPGVTPAKFRYRPLGWLLRGRAARPRGEQRIASS